MTEENTPKNKYNAPANTPDMIIRALIKADSTQFCTLHGDLLSTDNGEYSIEATIGSSMEFLKDAPSARYKVKILIPREFPYRPAHVVPIDPELKWFPHQFGDWPLEYEPHANVICPPRLNETYLEEFLRPYLRGAYEWITDALKGTVTKPKQRYEFPHLVRTSTNRMKIYVEGGHVTLSFARRVCNGQARLTHLKNSPLRDGLFRVTKLVGIEGKKSKKAEGYFTHELDSELEKNPFGHEEASGWVPWVYAGNPVVAAPHRPPVFWNDLNHDIKVKISKSLIHICASQNPRPIVLLCYEVPETWGGSPSGAVWVAFEIEDFDPQNFKKPLKGGFYKFPLKWPAVSSFIKKDRRLRFLTCTDVSKSALLSRAMTTTLPINQSKIAIIGAGAVGSMVAKALSKLNPRGMLIIDGEQLVPGNIVRHECHSWQVEHFKASIMFH